MSRIYISIGSNIDRENNFRSAHSELLDLFGELTVSPVYESKAVGFDGDNFFNAVIACETTLTPHEVVARLREIENRHHRDRSAPRFSSRTLDLDLLLYDDVVLADDNLQLPRREITKNAFVLAPLVDLIPTALHPTLQQSYADMWRDFDRQSQLLWRVPFVWSV